MPGTVFDPRRRRTSATRCTRSGRTTIRPRPGGGVPVDLDRLARHRAHPRLVELDVEQVGHAEELGHERGGRGFVDLLRTTALDHLAVVHHGQSMAHRQRLFLVVGDEDEGDPHRALQGRSARPAAPCGAWRPARRAARPAGAPGAAGRAPGPGPLVAAGRRRAGSGRRPASRVRRTSSSASPTCRFASSPVTLAKRSPKPTLSRHREVREQGIALEDGVDGALLGRDRRDVLPVDQHPAAGRPLEATDHPQRRRLAAPRGTEQGEELAGLDVEVDAVDRQLVVEALLQLLQRDGSATGRSLLHRVRS